MYNEGRCKMKNTIIKSILAVVFGFVIEGGNKWKMN